MNLTTIFTLNYGDEGETIEEDDRIKIYLKSEEILIGKYTSSDCVSLYINRENDEMNIDFEDIEDIKKLD